MIHFQKKLKKLIKNFFKILFPTLWNLSVVIMLSSKDTSGVKFLMQKLVCLGHLMAIWFSFVFEN